MLERIEAVASKISNKLIGTFHSKITKPLYIILQVKYPWTTEIMFVIFLILVSIIIMNMIVGLAISNITKIFQESGILRLRMTVDLLKIMEDLMTSVEIFPCLLKGIEIIPQLRKPSTLKEVRRGSFNTEIEKKIYVCPNHIEKNRNIRMEDEGREIISNAKLPPWIIENVFKIKQNIAKIESKQKSESSQYLKMKNEIDNLRKEVSILSAKMNRNKS